MLDVLLVDDDDDVRESIAGALSEQGHRVTQAPDGTAASALVDTRAFHVALCDVHLPDVGGMTLFRKIRAHRPDTAVVLMTSFARVEDAVGTLRDGALDFLIKPFDPFEFGERVLRRIEERVSIQRRADRARIRADGGTPRPVVIDDSPAMCRLMHETLRAAGSDSHVLLRGERGSGKSLVSQILHAESSRSSAPFLVLPAAPTVRQARSAIESARGGTLVLEEVVLLGSDVQGEIVALLRTLPNVRLLAQTQVDTPRLSKALLPSLLDSLRRIELMVPALRERRADVLTLFDLFAYEAKGMAAPVLSTRASDAVARYPFPGNGRELRAIVGHALGRADRREIDLRQLPPEVAEYG